MLSIRNPLSRLRLALPLLALLVSGPLAAQAGRGAVNINDAGVALQGYDPVAYFTDAKPVKGTAAHVMAYGGATYHFASVAHRDAFAANPAKYTPAYGGYCAMGVAIGKKLDADPTLWRIVEGKLYLNVNADAQKMWLKDVPKHVAAATEQWSAVSTRKGFDRM